MVRDLQEYKNGIESAFAKNKVVKAFVFGSFATGEIDESSDIDFLVEFEDNLTPLQKGELWWALYDQLREITQRNIDLLTPSSLKNPYFIESLERTKKLIYAA